MKPALNAIVIATFAGALGAAVACNRTPGDQSSLTEKLEESDKSGAPSPPDQVSMTTTTGAEIGAASTNTAVDRIVAARCARESECEKVTGQDIKAKDPAICKQRLGDRVAMDLQPRDCARGVDNAALATCLQSITSESCTNPADTVQRLANCRTRELCIKTSDGR